MSLASVHTTARLLKMPSCKITVLQTHALVLIVPWGLFLHLVVTFRARWNCKSRTFVCSYGTWLNFGEYASTRGQSLLEFWKIHVSCMTTSQFEFVVCVTSREYRTARFQGTVNYERRVNLIRRAFSQELARRKDCYFVQNVATSHTANWSLLPLGVSGDEWPPSSPGLILCDFHLWGILRGKVGVSSPYGA